jgi:hypothetical protein
LKRFVRAGAGIAFFEGAGHARDPGPLVDNPAMKMNNWLTKGIGRQ